MPRGTDTLGGGGRARERDARREHAERVATDAAVLAAVVRLGGRGSWTNMVAQVVAGSYPPDREAFADGEVLARTSEALQRLERDGLVECQLGGDWAPRGGAP